MAEAPDPDNSIPQENTDPEENKVASDTEKVFRSFVFQRLTSEIDKESTEGDLEVGRIPPRSIHIINNLRGEMQQQSENNQGSVEEEQLGTILATFGDEINNKYKHIFSDMLCRLNIGEEEDVAYETFSNIARRLFENGINWGRIIALLYFGYEVAFVVIKRSVKGLGNFLRKLIRFVVDFVVKEKIAKWIAANGGWVAALIDLKQTGGVPVWALRGLALAGIVAVIYGVYKLCHNNNGK